MTVILDDRHLDLIRYIPGGGDVACETCDHYRGGFRCDAFLDIPHDILEGHNDHREPYPGDHGILYTPIESLPI